MTIHALTLKPAPEIKRRTTAHVHTYEGPGTEEVLQSLLTDRFTGPITLHVRTGRVQAIEWREKLRGEPQSVA